MSKATGQLTLYRPKVSEESVNQWLAEELGSMLNIKKVFLDTVCGDFDVNLGLSLAPLDVQEWMKYRNDDDMEDKLGALRQIKQLSPK